MCQHKIIIFSYKRNRMEFVGNMIWTFSLLSTFCECGTMTISKESTAVTTTSTAPISPTTTTSTLEWPMDAFKRALFLCQCDSDEVMNHTGQCQPQVGGTKVPMEPPRGSKQQGPQLTPTTDFNISINEPECPYRQIDLQDGQFMLRRQGDLLVFKGDFRGFRLADFCIHHSLVEGRVEVTARGCVPQPVIPRCCPQGEHITGGECVKTSNILMSFKPYLTIALVADSPIPGVPFPWDDHEQHIGKPSCRPGNILKKLELDGHKSYLAVLLTTVYLSFLFDEGQRLYSPSYRYCVDVQDKDEKYYAHSCKWDPEVYCKDRLCINKCCPEGMALSISTRDCTPNDTPFKPSFITPTNSSETIYGIPKCPIMTDIKNVKLPNDSTLIHGNTTYQPPEFCTDNLINGASVETGALVCTNQFQATTWRLVRKTLIPVCVALSCVALVLLILLHVWIPKLRKKEGKYQLFHVASLFLVYSVSLVGKVLVPNGYATGLICTAIAFVMQFAYLSAFFWLNTMCFDVWRLFRNLVINLYSIHSTVAMWKYMLYALGGPITITVITIIIQYIAPADGSVPGLVHPNIGEGRCWFNSWYTSLAYFYAPVGILFLLNFILIGTTYQSIKIISGDTKTTKYPSEYTIASEETTRKYDFFSAFWQRFYLLVMMATCWSTEILSVLLPNEELWAATDTLNSLQGVYVCVIFLAHHNKRALVKEKLPKLFKFCNICINHARTVYTSIKNSTENLSMKTSMSSILTYMRSFLPFSTSSFDLNKNELSMNTASIGIKSLSLVRKDSEYLYPNVSPGKP